ncbi:hypothetical protein ABEB36_001344 [Hypothenemus hampei]|uniref:Palmitoyltransferase n=1 Tax=Hypothenemus hampei TaxID=57062 RepID=A0ABD1FEA0_HYPHA
MLSSQRHDDRLHASVHVTATPSRCRPRAPAWPSAIAIMPPSETTVVVLEPPRGGRPRRSSSVRLRRQHGFQPPFHPLQLCGWLTLAALAVGALLYLVPALPFYAQPAAAAALSTLLLIHLATHLGAVLIDPAEEALRQRVPLQVPQLDRTKHTHVIEGGICHLCQIHVSGSRTKHCSACNKCVTDFDHHCKWLNQCVGGRNYSAFLMCVSSAVAAAALVAALAVANLIYHHIGKGDYQETVQKDEAKLNATTPPSPFPSSLPSSDAAFLAIVAALGLLAAITAGLLLHLCFFHIYISFLGLTTYEYIRQQRQIVSQTPATSQIESQTYELEANGKEHGSSLRHRPANLECGESRSRTTFFTCTLFEETFLSCNGTEPTPTPPSTPQDCQICVMTNSVAPEIKLAQKKVHRKWNCCVSVPDSPDDPQSPLEPRCLMSLCKHKAKSKKMPPALETGRSHRTHGYWSRAKLRLLFRVLGNLGQQKRRNPPQSQSNSSQAPKGNQVTPHVGPAPNFPVPVQSVSNLVPITCYPEASRRANSLPSLPNPPRRRLISETELANALTLLQQQQQRCGGRRPTSRRRRRSVVHRPKTPALSPIRESGLSNPASPSKQSCAIAGACTKPGYSCVNTRKT